MAADDDTGKASSRSGSLTETSGHDDGRGENLRGILHEVLLGDGWTHAEEAVVLFDEDRNYLAVNDAYCALIGYSREEIMTIKVGGTLVVNQPSHDLFREILTADSPRIGRALVRRKDGLVISLGYRMIRTTVSQLPYLLATVWQDNDGEEQSS